MSKPVTREALAAEKQRKRQADIAHADNADAGFAGLHFVLKGGKRASDSGRHSSILSLITGNNGGLLSRLCTFLYPVHCAERVHLIEVDSGGWRNMWRSILVTGVAGFIGRFDSRGVAEARRVGPRHRQLHHRQAREPRRTRRHGVPRRRSGRSGSLRRACEGVEIVFHEAALASVPRSVADPVGTNVNCVDATLNLLVAARAAGVRRVMYAGSSSVYGDSPTLPKHEQMLPNPISPYAVAKLAGEQYLRSFARVYGLETVTLRYFNVFGPHQDPTSQYSGVLAVFCRKMLAGEQPTIYGDGEQSRDFTYIENVVHANLLAASAPAAEVSGQMMNVATGSRITLNETFAVLRQLTGYSGEPAYAELAHRRHSRLACRHCACRRASRLPAKGRFPRRTPPHSRVVQSQFAEQLAAAQLAVRILTLIFIVSFIGTRLQLSEIRSIL